MKTLFVDCSHVVEDIKLNTGIQRVVRQCLHHLIFIGQDQGFRVQPVKISHGKFELLEEEDLYRLRQVSLPSLSRSVAVKHYFKEVFRTGRLFLSAVGGHHPKLAQFLFAPRHKFGLAWLVDHVFLKPIKWLSFRGRASESVVSVPLPDNESPLEQALVKAQVEEGDVLLLLDATWHCDIWPSVRAAKQKGVQVIGVVYDLIPVTHPEYCDDYLVEVFHRWFMTSVRELDGYIAISRTVQEQLLHFLRSLPGSGGSVDSSRLDYFWLGADFPESHEPVEIREALLEALAGKHPWLVVATIEPRKNHVLVLDAFERLWDAGLEVPLFFVGRPGWKVDALLKRLADHPLAGRLLFYWKDLSDAELDYCYQAARMLIFPSRVEGFGLPIVESLNRGLPVLASDIPIHREVGGKNIGYFDLDQPEHLAKLVTEVEQEGVPAEWQVPQDFCWLSWQESSVQLLEAVQRLTDQQSSMR